MHNEKFKIYSAVYLILVRNNKILLLRRFNTGWSDGSYSLVSGHLDGAETINHAMLREASEEAGISIEEKDLQVIHTMHRISPDREYIDFFLTTTNWKGLPINKESNKCDDLKWFDLDKLPKNVIPNVKQALKLYQKNITFSEFRG